MSPKEKRTNDQTHTSMEENMKKKAVVFVFLVSLGLSILGAHSVVAAQYPGRDYLDAHFNPR